MKIPQIILKNKLTSLLILGILVLGTILYFTRVKLGNVQEDLYYAQYKDSVEVGITKSGDSVRTIYIQKIQSIPDTRKYDSLLRELSIKKSHVDQITTIKTVTRVDTITAPATTDTVYSDGVRYYSYEDKDISFDAEAGQKLKLKNLEIPANLSIVSHTQSGHQKLSVTSDNKYLKIQDIKSVDYIDQKRPSRIGVGIGLGYGMGKNGLGPQVTIGLTYNILQFKKK